MNMYQFNEKHILDTLSANKEDPEECLKIIAELEKQFGNLQEFLIRQKKFFKNYKKNK